MPTVADIANTSTQTRIDAAIARAVSTLDDVMPMDDVSRRHVEQAIRRCFPSKREKVSHYFYLPIAKQYSSDGELEIDDDAPVSVAGDERGAYVQAWLWIGNEELLERFMSGDLILSTRDNRTGAETFVTNGKNVYGFGIDWDCDGDDQTKNVTFDVDGRSVFELTGDQWRNIENAGFVDELVLTAFTSTDPQVQADRIADDADNVTNRL